MLRFCLRNRGLAPNRSLFNFEGILDTPKNKHRRHPEKPYNFGVVGYMGDEIVYIFELIIIAFI